MARMNLAKRYEELQRIQQAFRDAKKLVERDLGRKVLEFYLAGADEKEIYRAVQHVVDEVYAYRKFLELKGIHHKKEEVKGNGSESYTES